MRKRTGKEKHLTRWERSEEKERERDGKQEYRTWWERSEEKETGRNGKQEYRAWWEKAEEKETGRNRMDEYPPRWETFDGKQTEKTTKRNEIPQGSRWLTVKTGRRTSHSSQDKYATGNLEKQFRTRLLVTDRLSSGRNLADDQLIAESSSTVNSMTIRQYSSWSMVKTDKRTTHTSQEKYATGSLEKPLRASLVATDRLSSGRNLAGDQLIAESSLTVHSTGEPNHLTEKAIPLCLPNNIRWNPRTGRVIKCTDARRSLYVVKEAFEELQKIKEPLCVISIAGPCRDGKSYILSRAFRQPDVFPVGHKMDPETMGIWIWILPHSVKASKLLTQLIL